MTKFLRNGTDRILKQGYISKASGSTNKLAVLNAVRKHILGLAPLCFSQFVKDGTVAVTQERDGNGRKCSHHNSVAMGVWQGSTLSSATFCVTLWSKMRELLDLTNAERPAMGFISYADDFMISADKDEPDNLWDETIKALEEVGLVIDQTRSCHTRQERTEWNHREPSFKENAVVLDTEANERISAAADENDETLARGCFQETCEFAGHVETITQLHLDTRKTEALWLTTSKSVARALDFRAKEVCPRKVRPLAVNLEPKTRDICEELTERPLPDDDWTRMKLPTSLGGMGIRAVTSQLEVSFGVTEKKTSAQAVRHEKSVEGKRDFPEWRREHDGNELWDWAHSIGHVDRVEAMSGPFKWDLVKVSMGHQFFTLRQTHPGIARGHQCAKTLDQTQHNRECCFPGQLRTRCGSQPGRKRS